MKFKGLKKVVSEIKEISGNNRGFYYEVFYNKETDTVFSEEHVSLGKNSWTEYDNVNIIRIGNFDCYVSMSDLKDLIKTTIAGADKYEI